MNKQAIQKTAITRWDQQDECFIVSSPLMDSIIGVGDSVEEAQFEFTNILSDAYEAYLEGRMPTKDKAGRPTKNRTALNTDVKPETRAKVKAISKNFGISQGEVLDYVVAFYEAKNAEVSAADAAPKSKSLAAKELYLPSLGRRQSLVKESAAAPPQRDTQVVATMDVMLLITQLNERVSKLENQFGDVIRKQSESKSLRNNQKKR